MRLEPLYRMSFTYPQAWSVALAADGTEPDPRLDVGGRRNEIGPVATECVLRRAAGS
jgi:hypothetical protein